MLNELIFDVEISFYQDILTVQPQAMPEMMYPRSDTSQRQNIAAMSLAGARFPVVLSPFGRHSSEDNAMNSDANREKSLSLNLQERHRFPKLIHATGKNGALCIEPVE